MDARGVCHTVDDTRKRTAPGRSTHRAATPALTVRTQLNRPISSKGGRRERRRPLNC